MDSKGLSRLMRDCSLYGFRNESAYSSWAYGPYYSHARTNVLTYGNLVRRLSAANLTVTSEDLAHILMLPDFPIQSVVNYLAEDDEGFDTVALVRDALHKMSRCHWMDQSISNLISVRPELRPELIDLIERDRIVLSKLTYSSATHWSSPLALNLDLPDNFEFDTSAYAEPHARKPEWRPVYRNQKLGNAYVVLFNRSKEVLNLLFVHAVRLFFALSKFALTSAGG
jgi:hypothetical protein